LRNYNPLIESQIETLRKNFLEITCKKEKLEKRIKLEKKLPKNFGDRFKKKLKRGDQKSLLFSLMPSSSCNRDILFIHSI